MLKGKLMVLVAVGLVFGACSDAGVPTSSLERRGSPANDECIMCGYSAEITGPTSVQAGGSASWSVYSDAPGDAEYTWKLNGTVVSYSSSLYINPVNSGGDLEVVLRSPGGSIYAQDGHSFSVTNPPPPAGCPQNPLACWIQQQASPTSVQAGGQCQFGANTSVPVNQYTTIQWSYWNNGNPIPIEGATSLAITIGAVPQEDFDLLVEIYYNNGQYQAYANWLKTIPVGGSCD